MKQKLQQKMELKSFKMKILFIKKNVKILSDNFNLNADDVKINFDKSLYDITELKCKRRCKFFSSNEFEINRKW